jgi:ribokinase
MNKNVAIRVIGSINLDIVASGTALPRAGETVTGATLAYHAGGKGANQALAARRLGGEVAMIGCVGADPAADQAMALLRADGVNVSGVSVNADLQTGVALIAVSSSGENQIIVAPGANEAMSAETIGDIGQQTYDATICQLEIPVATIEAIAASVTGFFAINLAPAQTIPPSILSRADLIIVNETEAAFYGDALYGLRALVVVTLGSEGAIMHQGTVHQGTEGTITAKPPKVRPVDTTGAGDTFVGALVLALMEGQSRQDAMNFACAAGAAATLTAGAQPSLPDRATVHALMGIPS